jgi:hypothetical protein
MFRPYLTILCAFYLFSTQACGCGQRPAFPAPSDFRGRENDASPGRISAAGMRRRVLVIASAVLLHPPLEGEGRHA